MFIFFNNLKTIIKISVSMNFLDFPPEFRTDSTSAFVFSRKKIIRNYNNKKKYLTDYVAKIPSCRDFDNFSPSKDRFFGFIIVV